MKRPSLPLALALLAVLAALAAGSAAAAGGYTVQALVSDQPGVATFTDATLVNGWGIVASATSPWWVSNQGTSTSTLYNGLGQRFPLAAPILVTIAPPGPTGIVFNGGTQFLVPNGAATSPARFIFATLSGTIQGWAAGPAAQLGASSPGSVYTGLAIAGNQLYAADFRNHRIDVFDGAFHVVTAPGAFLDPKVPNGYGPFGIQNIGGHIFVAYAKQGPDGRDQAGRGNGIVDEYDLSGALVARVQKGGKLNSPWGITQAPATGFGELSGDLLVGNFGDGRINAFAKDAAGEWQHVDQLRDPDGLAVEIDGLWGIGFGNGGNAGPATSLYFAAGPDDETHGLFGSVRASS